MTQKKLKFGKVWDAEGVVSKKTPSPIFTSENGILYEGDCLDILPNINDESVDTVFADPPFNLNKKYGKIFNDNLSSDHYIQWCKSWLDECVRILKPGGSMFIYNLPKWNIIIGGHLFDRGLILRHWIAVNIKACLPIPKRLYPSHYSLLYFAKGNPKTFHKIRTPILKCRHCHKEIKDYGGHRGAMNPLGVNLTDIWDDIPPVRHAKFKSEKRKANQLSTKLLFRVIRMSTNEEDVVLDPFGGSGTTFDVCEREGRHWIGIEMENCHVIVERLQNGDISHHKITDYVEK